MLCAFIPKFLAATALFGLSAATEIVMFTKRSNYWTKRLKKATVHFRVKQKS
jgi:hypothetical protein